MGRVTIIALVLLLLIATPVAAHGNSIAIDAQATADGTVHVELVSFVTDGYIVLHTDADGSPGRVIGHAALADKTIQHGVSVSINEDSWTNQTGTTVLWAVLHREVAGQGFDPADDPPQETADGDVVQARFKVQKRSNGSTRVLAEQEPIEETNTSTVTVRHVALAEGGFVVLRADKAGTPGRIIGSQFLDAGVHESVTLDIDEDYFTNQSGRFTVWAVAHTDDGDENFSPNHDPVIEIDETPIQTQFAVLSTAERSDHDHDTEQADENHHNEPTPTVTPTARPQPTTTTSPPPSPTPTPLDRATPTATATRATPTSTVLRTPTATQSQTTTISTPGFTGLTALIAISLSLLLARRRLS